MAAAAAALMFARCLNPGMMKAQKGWFASDVAVMVWKYAILVVTLLLLTGCGFLSLGQPNLASHDPALKIPAIKAAARHHDQAAVPVLIQALSSSDSAIRFYAIYALRQITGHEFGYVYYAPQRQRDKAITQWKKWFHASHGGGIHPPAAVCFPASSTVLMNGSAT